MNKSKIIIYYLLDDQYPRINIQPRSKSKWFLRKEIKRSVFRIIKYL